MADEPTRAVVEPINVYLDEEIDADSIEELRAKAADLAEEAWRREVAFRAELAARPASAAYEAIASAETVRLWGERMVAEVTRRWAGSR